MNDVAATDAAGAVRVLLELAEAALVECGAEPVTTRYVAAGQIAWDECCGLLVAAPERIFRTAEFPIEGADVICETSEIAVEAVVLLLRCVPTLDDRGQAPAAESLDDAYSAVLRDAAVIWNAVVGELPEGWSRANVNQLFVGAEGGCIGVETRITVGLPQDRWCPTCTEEP